MSEPVLKRLGATTSDNDTVFEIASNGEQFDTWQLGSSAGVMDVFVAGDGTNYFATPVALIDLGSATPSVAVVETTAGGNYGIRGRWPKLIVRQKGATAVVGAYLIGY
jgi:hypothetical protein